MVQTDHSVRISNEFHLAARLAPAHAHGSATISAQETTIGNGCAHQRWWVRAQHSAAPLEL
jgi:hypothetical protein